MGSEGKMHKRVRSRRKRGKGKERWRTIKERKTLSGEKRRKEMEWEARGR